MILFPLDKYPDGGLLDHVEVLFLTFSGPTVLLSIVAAAIYIPGDRAQVSLFLILASCHFDDRPPNRCETIAHCGFAVHFPGDQWSWAPFHGPVGHLYIGLEKKSVLFLCQFLIGLFVSAVELYKFFIYWGHKSFYQIYDLQVFSPILKDAFSFCWWFCFLCRSVLVCCRSAFFINPPNICPPSSLLAYLVPVPLCLWDEPFLRNAEKYVWEMFQVMALVHLVSCQNYLPFRKMYHSKDAATKRERNSVELCLCCLVRSL